MCFSCSGAPLLSGQSSQTKSSPGPGSEPGPIAPLFQAWSVGTIRPQVWQQDRLFHLATPMTICSYTMPGLSILFPVPTLGKLHSVLFSRPLAGLCDMQTSLHVLRPCCACPNALHKSIGFRPDLSNTLWLFLYDIKDKVYLLWGPNTYTQNVHFKLTVLAHMSVWLTKCWQKREFTTNI